ncbi:MAG: AEC family transporter [Proteobacteria bacterium]|nr:AEC family transporter [Pseudomonadota bacterium]
MEQILGSVLPLFAIIGLGKLATSFGFLDAAGSVVLSRFAFFLLIPALLFGLIATGPASDVFGPGGVYFLGCLFVYCLALCVGRWLNGPSWPAGAVFALDTTFGNIVFLGAPLVLSLYGEEGLRVLVGTIIFTTLLLPLSSILMQVGGSSREAATVAAFRKLTVDLLKNPAINSVIVGFLWRATGWPLPTPMHTFVDLLAKAAAPIALFCIGATLPAISWGVMKEALSATFMKLIVTPTVVGFLCFWAGFTGDSLAVPVVAAALPTGANAFLLARSATAHSAAVSATTVVMATALSIITLSALLYWLSSMP